MKDHYKLITILAEAPVGPPALSLVLCLILCGAYQPSGEPAGLGVNECEAVQRGQLGRGAQGRAVMNVQELQGGFQDLFQEDFWVSDPILGHLLLHFT